MARAGLDFMRVNLRRLHALAVVVVVVVLVAMACELVSLHLRVADLERRADALERSSP